LAGVLDLLKISEGLSVPEADRSVPLTVLSEASMWVASPAEPIVLAVSPAATAPEASVVAIHWVVFPVAVTPAAATSVAEVMAEGTDNQGSQRTPKRIVWSSFFICSLVYVLSGGLDSSLLWGRDRKEEAGASLILPLFLRVCCSNQLKIKRLTSSQPLVCVLLGAITLFTSSEARFSQRAYASMGLPVLCFHLFGLNPFWVLTGSRIRSVFNYFIP